MKTLALALATIAPVAALLCTTGCGADDGAGRGRQPIVVCQEGDPQCPPTTPPGGDGGTDGGDGGSSDGGGKDGDDGSGRADLPYNYELSVGDTFVLNDAFAAKGPLPAAVLSVEAPPGTLYLAELKSGTPFTVKSSDCDHVGNKDVGRDRIVVTWRNVDGSTETDHMTLRYCGH